MVTLPRLVVAAPASGQGKTTVAVGLMAALSRLGNAVAPAKVGPDYIDPGYHALATGRPGRNLDPWLTSPELIAPLLLHGAATPAPADVAIIEGVMGLFDGQIGTDGFSSTAHVARLVDAPVLLVVDISSAARTVAALVHGLSTFDPAVRVAGVILNKAGSPRHAGEVRRSLEARGVPVLGVLPRDAGVSAPSRHLGLVPAAERADAAAALDRLAEQTATHVDVGAVLELARTAPPLAATPWAPPVVSRSGAPRVVAVAGGRAFTFRYAETSELLRAAGCEVVEFDPATDRSLPSGTSGLYLGGGFPEAHAAALAQNTTLLGEVRDAVHSGMPTVAECAGLLYLAQALDDHAMVGAVPATAAMGPRLTLRYVTATLPVDGLLGPAGTAVHAHEFHRTTTDPPALGPGAWHVDGVAHGFALDPAGTGMPTLHAAYPHVHWAGNPSLATHFANAVHAFAPSPSVAGYARVGAAAAVRTTNQAAGVRTPHQELGALDHHGDAEVRDDGAALVDLAVNVRVTEPPAWLSQAVQGAPLAAYPDAREARSALARRHGIPADCVLPTSGAAEAFSLIARAISGRHPLIVHPQFTEPEAALRRAGRVPDRHVLRAETGFVLDPAAVDPRADLVVIGNPTNPTGVVHARSTLNWLRHSDRVLVIDEAFGDAVPGEPDSLITGDLTGLLVVRSITKTWGLAGLRAGYVVGDPDLIAALADQQPPWSVSTPAAIALALTATPDALAEAEESARQTLADRAVLVQGLESLGLRPVPGQAPFVLVEVGHGVREALRDTGYAVRRGDTFPGLDDDWVRIAVRDAATSAGLLTAVEAALHSLRSATPKELTV
ncbi:MAG: cobyrinate a,c-diamide synthase [Phycicoccus sp.]|nr:cobyrinate a,c-diamide synthase [Phycicoccus sp.]